MTKKELSDEEIVEILTPWGILANMGYKCITTDGKDITDDLKKVVKIE